MNIIVTGAGKGIGFEICKLLSAEAGHHVLAITRDTRQLTALSCQNKNLLPFSFDLEKDDYETIVSKLPGKVDILINNAGYLVNKPFAEITEADIERTFYVNFTAAFKLTQLLIPRFNKNAHVVNISSMGGFQGSAKFHGLSVYSASKAALSCLTECLAEELKEKQIKVNCLCLGAVQTEMLEKAFPGYKAPVQAKDMASYICVFARNAHHYLNGKIIPVSVSTP
jgi:NAD(P)-dependent dehydrogenase (short-subunit alcohol dehydrogenase family)